MRTVLRILEHLYGPIEATGPSGVTVVALGYENWWVAFSDADRERPSAATLAPGPSPRRRRAGTEDLGPPSGAFQT